MKRLSVPSVVVSEPITPDIVHVERDKAVIPMTETATIEAMAACIVLGTDDEFERMLDQTCPRSDDADEDIPPEDQAEERDAEV